MRRKTKKLIIAIAAGAVACAGIAWALAGGPGQGQPADPPAAESASSEDAPPAPDAATSSGKADGRPTAAQLEDLDWYSDLDDSARGYVENIMRNTWSSDKSAERVTFTSKGKIKIERDGQDKPETHTVKIQSVDNSERGVVGDAVMIVDGDGYKVSVKRTKKGYAMTTDLLPGEELERVGNSRSFSVEGTDKAGWKELMGKTKTADFERALRDWCTDNVPMATSAEWVRSWRVIPARKTVETSFTLDNSEATVVYADRTDGKWSFVSADDRDDETE